MTESNSTKRGGKRDNAGRKSTHGGQTKTIRVNVELIPAIEKLQTGQFDFVTESNQDEIAGLKAELATSYLDNQSQYKEYQAEYDTLKENFNQVKVTNTTLTRQNTKLSKDNEQLKIDLKNHDTANATFIRRLKHEHEGIIESWSNQCKNLQTELDQYKTTNLKLVEQRDTALQKLKTDSHAERMQVVRNETLATELDNLQRKFDAGTNKVCQCVTSNGTQCTRSADRLIQTNDVMIWTCKQHGAKYPNAKPVF